MPAARPIAVKLDPDVFARMRELAKVQQRSTHCLMREAISQYVDREEKREDFRQGAVRAWAEYQATGLHVTHPEADNWLAQLAVGQDMEPPKCHS
jgi:predicted transcriptional regulator